MKRLRVSAAPDLEAAPEFFRLLAASDRASEARLLDWNLGPAEAGTLLYAVRGDPDGFRASATDTPGIDAVDVAETGSGEFYMLVDARPDAVPLFRRMVGAMTRAGLVVVTPVVYRDERVEGTIVGDPAALQATLDSVPDAVDVTVSEVGPFRGPPESPGARLSDRQREAVEAALDLGYYDHPSGATHEDIATELGCAPSTASEHLKRAEAKLARAALDEFGPAV
ncbi:helix-turn-helix domain-containing protein [Halosimplex halophilum]|uniref:helix-turn-helix domain-containing protein n=1 Tax=Halosimplex halophilum TaxID=2559572 RepID=UPI00107EF15D|nr:helix-turn-helix domain-containing protein [Halosimplex halophilum]